MSCPEHQPEEQSTGAAEVRERAAGTSGFAWVLRSYASVVVLCLAMLATPAVVRLWADRAWPALGTPSYLPALERTRARVPFDRQPIRELQRRNPAFVFVGDSMLRSRLDRNHFESLLPNRMRVWRLSRHATGSAYWWLVLKNWIVPSGVRPRRVFVFFRDDNLTDPLFRLTGASRVLVDAAARGEEPELNRAVARRLNGTWHPVYAAINSAYDGDRLGPHAERSLSRFAARLADSGRHPDAFLRSVNRLFDLTRLRAAQEADVAEAGVAGPRFEADVEASILPDMLDLASRSGLSLVFVRVQRRPDANGVVRQSPAMRQYVFELRRYLESHRAVLVDFTGDPGVPPAWYGNGDHIAPLHRKDWTNLFHQRVGHLLR